MAALQQNRYAHEGKQNAAAVWTVASGNLAYIIDIRLTWAVSRTW